MFAGFIDHGVWNRYTPDPIPVGVPSNAMFAQRVSDSVDWYSHVHNAVNFDPATIKFSVVAKPSDGAIPAWNMIMAVALDADAMFPSTGDIVIEMTGNFSGSTVDQLFSQYHGRAIDLNTGAITPPPEAPVSQRAAPSSAVLTSILQRLYALENRP